MDAYAHALDVAPDIALKYRSPAHGGSKVVLRSKNQNQLISAYLKAMELGIPCALVADRHHVLPPHFDGSPVLTALGIGPCTRDQARQITKKFQCV